jgi:hypothetical protein
MTTKVNLLIAEAGKQNANRMATIDLLNAGIANMNLAQVGPGQFALPQMVVAAFLEFDFAKAGRPVKFQLDLLDFDGNPVTAPGSDDPVTMRQVVRPTPTMGPAGTPVRANVLAVLQGLPVFPDTMYKWKATVDDEEREEWEASFYVVPLDVAPQYGQAQPPPES